MKSAQNAQDLERELVKRAVAWVLADRTCDDRMAAVDRVEREIDLHLRNGQASNRDRELQKKLKYENIGFTLACERESKCNEDLRAIAKKLVEELEHVGDRTELRVLHVLIAGRAACAFSPQTPSQWPPGHQWTSVAELREGITKIEDLSCEACAAKARVFLTEAEGE